MSDDKDVAQVLALDESVKKLLADFGAAQPALARLSKADYPGAEWLFEQVWSAITSDCSGGLTQVIEALDMLKAADGNVAAYDFGFYSIWEGATVDGAAKEMVKGLGTDIETLDRIKAMRRYAATVAQVIG